MHSFFANISHLKGKYMKVEEGEEISIKVVQLYQYHVPVHLLFAAPFYPSVFCFHGKMSRRLESDGEECISGSVRKACSKQ